MKYFTSENQENIKYYYFLNVCCIIIYNTDIQGTLWKKPNLSMCFINFSHK